MSWETWHVRDALTERLWLWDKIRGGDDDLDLWLLEPT